MVQFEVLKRSRIKLEAMNIRKAPARNEECRFTADYISDTNEKRKKRTTHISIGAIKFMILERR